MREGEREGEEGALVRVKAGGGGECMRCAVCMRRACGAHAACMRRASSGMKASSRIIAAQLALSRPNGFSSTKRSTVSIPSSGSASAASWSLSSPLENLSSRLCPAAEVAAAAAAAAAKGPTGAGAAPPSCKLRLDIKGSPWLEAATDGPQRGLTLGLALALAWALTWAEAATGRNAEQICA